MIRKVHYSDWSYDLDLNDPMYFKRKPEIYYPEEVSTMNRKGFMFKVVRVDNHNRRETTWHRSFKQAYIYAYGDKDEYWDSDPERNQNFISDMALPYGYDMGFGRI